METITFVYEEPKYWNDGLKSALGILSKKRDIIFCDITKERFKNDTDVIIGWGAFESPVDLLIRDTDKKKALCVAGNAFKPHDKYNLLFYETHWYEQFIENQEKIHAFGINTQIYKNTNSDRFIDYLTVGSFSLWKRQRYIIGMEGIRMAIGEIQKDNREESQEIIQNLLDNGVGVQGQITPQQLALYYNRTKTVYIPAEIDGGGERAVLEARACGCNVIIEDDNDKLAELLTSSVWDEKYYAQQLEKGLEILCQK